MTTFRGKKGHLFLVNNEESILQSHPTEAKIVTHALTQYMPKPINGKALRPPLLTEINQVQYPGATPLKYMAR